MRAIYINLDPYLAAFAAWLKGGKSGPAPSGPSVPLSVTVPLGESAALYCPAKNSDSGYPDVNTIEIDGESIEFLAGPGTFDTWPDGTLAKDVVPLLSKLAPDAKYGVVPISGDSVSVGVFLCDSDGYEIVFTIPVLVRRETASGPVDLVDFTPPAAAPSAAQINTALGGTGADGNAPLGGVSLAGAVIVGDDGESRATQFRNASGVTDPISGDPPNSLTYAIGHV